MAFYRNVIEYGVCEELHTPYNCLSLVEAILKLSDDKGIIRVYMA